MAGGKVAKDQPTQVGRALAHLGVEHIAASSPRAPGRYRAGVRDAAGPLPKELALAGMTTVVDANRFIPEVYIRPTTLVLQSSLSRKDRHSSIVPASISRRSCCTQEERKVGHDNTVAFNRLR